MGETRIGLLKGLYQKSFALLILSKKFPPLSPYLMSFMFLLSKFSLPSNRVNHVEILLASPHCQKGTKSAS